MRSFIAIELPQNVRTTLSDFGEHLRRQGAHASWVKPDVMHLTLRFLGDITQEQCDSLHIFLREAYCSLVAPVLLARGIGAFPSLRKPSILWAGLTVVREDLAAVQQIAESGARAISLLPDDKAFHPHVTLARLRKHDDAHSCAKALMPYLANGMTPEFGNEFKAANVVLFSSTLTRHGPIYRKLEEYELL